MPKKKKKNISSKLTTPTVQLFVALGVFAASVAIATGQGIATWEISLFQWVYNWPDFLYPFFFVVTQLGSIFMLLALLVIYLLKKRYHVVLRLLLTGTLAYLLSGIAKDLWGRDRPNDILDNIVNLDYIVRGPGFPSGHTALATALALTVYHYLPKQYKPWAIIWIVGVALSRIYLGIHFPMDIIGGLSIGWISYALFRHVRLYDITRR